MILSHRVGNARSSAAYGSGLLRALSEAAAGQWAYDNGEVKIGLS